MYEEDGSRRLESISMHRSDAVTSMPLAMIQDGPGAEAVISPVGPLRPSLWPF